MVCGWILGRFMAGMGVEKSWSRKIFFDFYENFFGNFKKLGRKVVIGVKGMAGCLFSYVAGLQEAVIRKKYPRNIMPIP